MSVTGYIVCPHCGNDDRRLMERLPGQAQWFECKICSKEFVGKKKEQS